MSSFRDWGWVSFLDIGLGRDATRWLLSSSHRGRAWWLSCICILGSSQAFFFLGSGHRSFAM